MQILCILNSRFWPQVVLLGIACFFSVRVLPCSGGGKSFGCYYKRRICRIYPSVIMSVLFVHLISMNPTFELKELAGGNFIMAIMVYYVLLYFVRKYALDNIGMVLIGVTLISLAVYILWFPYKYEVSSKGLYGITTQYRWIPYFGAMLIGAVVGMKRKDLNYHAWWDFGKLILCLALFYSIQFAAKIYRPVAPWQVVTLLPLMGITVYFYKWCNCDYMSRIYQSKWGNAVIMVVGGLCLESYLIQYCLFTDKMNEIWPLNLLIIVVIILLCSYIVRCIARWFAQTFRTEDYEWKKVFSLY